MSWSENLDWGLLMAILFIGGIILASFFNIFLWPDWFFIFLLATFLVFALEMIFLRKVVLSLFLILFFSLIAGNIFFQFQLEKTKQPKPFSEEKIKVLVVKDPIDKENYQKVFVEDLKSSDKFLVYLPKGFQINNFSCLELEGKIRNIDSLKNKGYQQYLLAKKVYGIIYYPKIEKRECPGDKGIIIKKRIFELKEKSRAIITSSLPDIQAELLGALILGDKEKIPDEWKEKLNRTGLRHIIAISGMHITIWITLLMTGLIFIGFWRQQAFYLAVLFLIFYLVFIGFPVSAIRAAIMAVIFLVGQNFGQFSDSGRLVIITAFLMLLFNPFLIYDIGFQLSVLAVLGIFYLTPFFEDILAGFKAPSWAGIRKTLAMSLSAQIFVVPILAYNFNYFSLISPLTNILVIPVLPFLILSGLALILFGFIHFQLVFFINWLASLILGYIIEVIRLFDQLDKNILYFTGFPPVLAFLYYFFLFLTTYFIIKQNRFKI